MGTELAKLRILLGGFELDIGRDPTPMRAATFDDSSPTLMVVLDTNVVSEPTQPDRDVRLLAWLDRQVARVAIHDGDHHLRNLAGVASLPRGKHKNGLSSQVELILHGYFGIAFCPLIGQLQFPRIDRCPCQQGGI